MLLAATVMPAVLRFNRSAMAAPLDRAAAYLEITGGYEGFCAFVDELNASLAIPPTLTALGVTDADLDALTRAALADPSTAGNPVEMTFANTRALFEACL